MRITSPPTMNPCFYGVDTPSKDKLMAANHDIESMAKLIGVDSLAFVTIDGLYRATGLPGRDNAAPEFCDACFTGDYPIKLTDHNAENKGRKLSQLVERQSA